MSEANDTAHNNFGGELEFLDATPDLSHVVFESAVGLTAEDPSAPGLYEWDAQSGGLQLVSVLPGGSPAPDTPSSTPALGDGGGLNERGALSSDGSRVLWSEGDETTLYLRDTARGETIAVSAAQGNDATEPGPGGQTLPEPAGRTQAGALPGRQQRRARSSSSPPPRASAKNQARNRLAKNRPSTSTSSS